MDMVINRIITIKCRVVCGKYVEATIDDEDIKSTTWIMDANERRVFAAELRRAADVFEGRRIYDEQ
jgi:hypothetical protein